MNHEQLAFFNQQLAAMLQSGLPLEASLKQLSATMARGPFRDEIQRLEAELEQGVPLDEALGRRQLPDLYVAMLRAGLQANNLPAVLTQAADYYGHLHTNWQRLKGLMVYPGLVLGTSLVVSAFLAVICTSMVREASEAFGDMMFSPRPFLGTSALLFQVWLPFIALCFTAAAFTLLLTVRRFRHYARWKLPAFREASLAQLGFSLATMLEQGTDLNTALEIVERNESNDGARRELAQWRQRLAGGARQFSEVAQTGALVPALFVWLVSSAGENWARGFRQAANIYDARAKYRMDLALYAALPVVILLLAGLISAEMAPLLRSFIQHINYLGNDGGLTAGE